MAGERILVVDDEENIIQLVRLYLERDGFRVSAETNGKAALEQFQKEPPDLVILDVMLPEVDGFEVCRRLRAANNPVAIIMLTARDEDIDKILGLELGADDYLTKPFNPRELTARVKAILRRTERTNSLQESSSLLIGNLEINFDRREVRCGGHYVILRTQEFEVLAALCRNRGRVLTREQLLNQAWGYDFAGQTRTVDVHVAQLRRKLEGCTAIIETVTGVGYKLVG